MFRIRMLTMTALAGLAGLTGGCKEEVTEPAPVTGQEYLQYHFESATGASSAKILIEPDGDGFTLTAENLGGFKPQKVNAALADGRRQIKLYYLGWLWLKPSARKVGGKTPVGDVKEQRVWNNMPVWVVAEHGGSSGKRYFHTETGFLVGMQIAVGGGSYQGRLMGTNIPGILPGT